MKWSESYLYTLKEDPVDAEIPSHKLLIRGGYIRKVTQGVFTYGFLALRALRKIEGVIRKHMDEKGGVEILMPFVQPRSLWDETSRWDEMGKNLLKFKNRNDQDHCLGATHEEVVTDYVRKDIQSYRDLPKILYQIQTKYRDEIRPRFGLMRGREFLMKDAYSFDASEKKALESYQKMKQAYEGICRDLGFRFQVVKADSGAIGGDHCEEFHVLAKNGEDHLLVSEKDGYAANIEVCPSLDEDTLKRKGKKEELKKQERIHTPKLRTIKDLSKFLKVPEKELVKTLFYETEKGPIALLLRGDDELNLLKLQKFLKEKIPPTPCSPETIKKITGANPGSCGPVGLKIPIYLEVSLEFYYNFVVGANEDDYHLKNVNKERDFKVEGVFDFRLAREGDLSPQGKGKLKAFRGIEVGHIFYLGEKYSEAMDLKFLDEKGKRLPVQMGCYGIGVSRILQAIVEQSHDEWGISWPISFAPFAVHICLLDPDDKETLKFCDKFYEGLKEKGVEVFVDDRKERPGVKFKDADLLGFPVRINIGSRGLKENVLEVVERQGRKVTKVKKDQILKETLKKVSG